MRPIRYFFYGIGCLSATLSLALLLAPAFLSSNTFQKKTLPYLCKKIGVDIQLEKLQVSWFHPQEIKNLSFKTEGCDFTVQTLTLEAPLWKIFLPGKDLGTLYIQKPTLTYSLDKLPQTEEAKDGPSWGLSFLIHPLSLHIEGGSIDCLTSQTLVSLQNIFCQAKFKDLETPLTAKIDAQTKSNQNQGSIHLNITIEEPTQWLESVCADVTVCDFPLELASAFVDKKFANLVHSWSREPLDFKAQFKRKNLEHDCQIHLSSAPLKTQIHFTHADNQLNLSQEAPFSIVLTKEELLPFLTETSKPLILQNDLEIQGQIESWNAPIQSPMDASWSLNALMKNFYLEKEGSVTGLDALEIKVSCKDSVYAAQLQSCSTAQIQLACQIGPTLDERGLQKVDLDLTLKPSDILPWMPIAHFDLGWAFPLKIKTRLQRVGTFLEGLVEVASNELSSKSILSLGQTDLQLKDSTTKLPSLNIGAVLVSPSELFISHARLPKKFSIDTCMVEGCLKLDSVSLENRTIEKIKLESKLDQSHLNLDLNSCTAAGATKLKISPSAVKFVNPLWLKVHLTPQEATSWIGDFGFNQPIDLDLQVTSGSWQANKPLEDQWLEASAKISQVILKKAPEAAAIGIPSTEMQLRSNLSAKSAHVMFYSLSAKDKNLVPAAFKGQAQIRDQKLVKAQAEISNLTSEWLDLMTGSQGKLAVLLGGDLNANVNLDLAGKTPLIHFSAQTPHVKSDFSWQQDTKWSLTKPAQLHFQLPAKVCTKLLQETPSQISPFELTQGIDFSARIDALETLGKELELSQIRANGEVFLKKAGIRLIPQDRYSEISNFKSSWKFDGPTSTFEQQLVANLQTTEKQQQFPLLGKIEGQSRHGDLLDKNQKLSIEHGSHKVHLKTSQLSTDWIDFAVWLSKKTIGVPLSELIGPSFRLQSYLEVNKQTGPIDFNFQSTYSYLDLKGSLQKDGLTLRAPFKAQLQPHPGLSRYFTSSKNKSSISSVSTKEPINVDVSEKNFFLPLTPFDIKKISIDQVHATMGAVEWQNTGVLHFFVNLLKDPNADSKTLTLEPLPIDLSMKDGIIHLERSDVLVAGVFPIAAWGTVDLSSQKLNLTVGVSKDALNNALSINDLPNGYMMLVPVHGPLSSPAAESALATTKLAALIARNSKDIVTQVAPQNPTGLLISGILGAIMPIPDEKAVVPPPRYPIPWKFAPKKTSKK